MISLWRRSMKRESFSAAERIRSRKVSGVVMASCAANGIYIPRAEEIDLEILLCRG